MTKHEQVLQIIRAIPDYPKKGIIFRDITPLLGHPEYFKYVVDELAKLCKDQGITKIVGIESRGFIFGAPLAYALGIGFVPVRKKGKLPYKKIAASFTLEYGTDTIEMHEDALTKDDKVILIDDLLATGGTTRAALELINKLGAKTAFCLYVIELCALEGGKTLNVPYKSLIKY
ncbi:MAG: adenine phosphoribosyltransferase [Elusimicrobiaceae bacterium]|nr:adenine phosphoribosyltransferase [Elusimicrobiaceae bacterium]